MAKEEIKECEKHGMIMFGEYKDGARYRWKCKACQVEATQRRREKVKEMSIEYKGGKCSVCGYSKCKGALEFHHLDPKEKDFGISAQGYTREERHSPEFFDTLKSNRLGVFIKLCDIKVNVLFSMLTNSDMYGKYKEEFSKLRQELYFPDEYEPLWFDLKKLL